MAMRTVLTLVTEQRIVQMDHRRADVEPINGLKEEREPSRQASHAAKQVQDTRLSTLFEQRLSLTVQILVWFFCVNDGIAQTCHE